MKKKISAVLVIPSSLSLSPYIYNYLEVFKKNNVLIDIVIWDRLKNYQEKDLESFNNVIRNLYLYTDKCNGIRRDFRNYLKYSRYIKKHVNLQKYERVIIFSSQLYMFLYPLLSMKQKILLDVRDYHKTIDYLTQLNLFKKINLIVVSSPAFSNFLPVETEIIVNHNTTITQEDIENITKLSKEKEDYVERKPIYIGSIGAFRDWNTNIHLIHKLKESNEIKLLYAGQGLYTDSLEDYIVKNKLKNVIVSGYFERSQLSQIYSSIDISNVLRDNSIIINKYALPNRLYDSLVNNKPLLSNRGNYLSELIEKYNIGLVIEENTNIENEIENYFLDFNPNVFKRNSIKFLNKVIKDNDIFEKKLLEFLNKEENDGKSRY